MSKPVHVHNARFGQFPVTCECGNVVTLALVRGNNRRVTVCARCKSFLRIECVYDGYGGAVLKTLTIEKVQGDEDGR